MMEVGKSFSVLEMSVQACRCSWLHYLGTLTGSLPDLDLFSKLAFLADQMCVSDSLSLPSYAKKLI